MSSSMAATTRMTPRSTRRLVVVSHRHRRERPWSVAFCILQILPAIAAITVATNVATTVKSAVSAAATQLSTTTHGLRMLRGGASSRNEEEEDNNNNNKYPRFLGDIGNENDRNDDFEKDILDEYVEFLLAYAEDRATEVDNPLFRDLPNYDMAEVDEEDNDEDEEEAESISVDLESVDQVDVHPQNMEEVLLADSLLKNISTIKNDDSVPPMDNTEEPNEDMQEESIVEEDGVSIQSVSEADWGTATQTLDGLSLDQQLDTSTFVEDVDQIDEYIETLVSSVDDEKEDQERDEPELVVEEIVPVRVVDDVEEEIATPFVHVSPTTTKADPASTTTEGMLSLDTDERAMDGSTEMHSMPDTTATLDTAEVEKAETVALWTRLFGTVRSKGEHQEFTDTTYDSDSSDLSVESNSTDTTLKSSMWNRFLDGWVETVLDDVPSLDDQDPEVILNRPSDLDDDEGQAAPVVDSEVSEPENHFDGKIQKQWELSLDDEKASSWSLQQYYHNTVSTAKDQYHRVWGTLNGFLSRPRDSSSESDVASSSSKPANYESTLRDHNTVFEKYFSQQQTPPTDNHGSEADKSDEIVTDNETQIRSPLDVFKRPWGSVAGFFNQENAGKPDSVESSPQAEEKENEDEGIFVFDTRPETETLPLNIDDESTASLDADELEAKEMILEQPGIDRGVEAESFDEKVEGQAKNVDIDEVSLTSSAVVEKSVSALYPIRHDEEIQKNISLAQVESTGIIEEDSEDDEADEEHIISAFDLMPPVDAPEINDDVTLHEVNTADEEHDEHIEDEDEEETLDVEADDVELDLEYEEAEEDEAVVILEDVDVVEADNEYMNEDSLLDLIEETIDDVEPNSAEFDAGEEGYDNVTEVSNARYDTTADHKREEDLLQLIGKEIDDVGFDVDFDEQEIDEEDDVDEKLEGARLVGDFDGEDIDISESDFIAKQVEYEGSNAVLKFLLNRGLEHWVMVAIVIFEWVRLFILAPLIETYLWIQNGEAQRLLEEGIRPPEWFGFRGGGGGEWGQNDHWETIGATKRNLWYRG